MPADPAVSARSSRVVWTPEHVLDLMARSPTHWPRYELVDGELLVTPAPAPRHQRALLWLLLKLQPYVEAHELGFVYLSPADIRLKPRSIVQPDLFVVPPSVRPKFSSWREVSALVLAVEAISPGSERQDRGRKRRHYMERGVLEYWIVDLSARRVERWRPGARRAEVLTDVLEWHPGGNHADVPPLRLDLLALFEEAGDE